MASFYRARLVLPLLLIYGVCPSALAQGQPLVQAKTGAARLTIAQARTLTAALTALSQQAKIGFVVEGRPLRPVLDDDAVNDLVKSVSLASVSDAADKVAAAFDYSVRQRDGIFVLAKKYTDPRDLPVLTVAELEASIKDVQRILAPFDPHVPTDITTLQEGVNSPIIARFVPTLTPEQKACLQSGTLSVAQLTAQQKEAIQRAATFLFVQCSLEGTQYDSATFKRTANAALGIGVQSGDQNKQKVFGYQWNDPYKRTIFYSLEEAPRQIFGPTGEIEPLHLLAPMEPDSAKASQTLGSVVALLNRRNLGEETRYRVDAILAAKPVLVIGLDDSAPAQVLAALADVYGLRVRTVKEENLLLLTRRYIPTPPNLLGIADAVQQALPTPLMRAAQIIPLPIEPLPPIPKALTDGTAKGEERARLEKELNEKMEARHRHLMMEGSDSRSDNLRREASRYLRARIEPQLKADPQALVPVASLGEEARVAFALIQLHSFLERMQIDYGRGTPSYISDFDNVILQGGPYKDEEGHWRYKLNLRSPGTVAGPGFANMRYNPDLP